MKKFETPKIEIEAIAICDVITTSGCAPVCAEETDLV